ncbi:DUF4159 domain-containing protein [bacterium]
MTKYLYIPLILISLVTISFSSSQRDSFVFTQIQYDGNWNPYPSFWSEVHKFLNTQTNLQPIKQARTITLDNNLLFSSPFICITGDSQMPNLTKKEIANLRKFIQSGGLLLVNDSGLSRNSPFLESVRFNLRKILPEYHVRKIADTHALYKSFYLINFIGGRSLKSNSLEGIFINGNLRVIICQNDIFAPWINDKQNNPVYECIPHGNLQRKEAKKLTTNIIVFSVTGTYKEDILHKPYLDQKLYDYFKTKE